MLVTAIPHNNLQGSFNDSQNKQCEVKANGNFIHHSHLGIDQI